MIFIRVLLALAGASATLFAAASLEKGEINGASFRIDVPESWKGGLVMFCHGYSATPVTYEAPKVYKLLEPFLDQGYAIAQSAYAATGWAIADAVRDTEALRQYFVRKYGAPKETYISGGSMGGFLTIAIIEKYPAAYQGGLALCGPLAPASVFIERRGFDLRVVFDSYFPGALPPIDKVPSDYSSGPERIKKLTALLDSKPQEAANVRRFAALRLNAEVAWAVSLFTNIVKDVQQRGGGNPFDNTNTIYEGTGDDYALNDRVRRYKADAQAAEYLRANYTPTGRLLKPLVAIHTTYDPLVPPWLTNAYSAATGQAGASGLFVQQYVKRTGHCAISPDDVASSFAQLRKWVSEGVKPPAGAIVLPQKEKN
jgi:alpha-beta hydrolase superfamily lysophospholipase